MPWSGTPPNESFSRTTGLQSGATSWADTEAAARGIESSDHDTHDQDLSDGLNAALKKDGGNKPTADIDWGGFKIANLGNPSSATDAANKQYVDDTATGFTNFTVRAASTANVNLTTDVDDGSTFDGLTLATNDLILLKDQTDASENGVYVVPAAAGTAARSTSFDTWSEFVGSIINVTAGTANAGLSFRSTVNSGGTLETTDITYVQFGSSITLPLAIDSGGTGQTTAAAAFNALKQAATDSVTGVVELATNAETVTGTDTSRATTPAGVAAAIAAGGFSAASQAQMEAASSTAVAVTPGRQHFHPGHPKCWAYVTVSGGVPTLRASYNITSITDTATGKLTVTIATDFSSANWAPLTAFDNGLPANNPGFNNVAAGSVLVVFSRDEGNEPEAYAFAGYGDQA